MDELFNCPGFCAVMRHSERFNSGSMKLDTNQTVYDDMIGQFKVLSSYDGED